MASLEELHDLYNSGPLKKKVSAALVIAAYNYVNAANSTPNQKKYARGILQDPIQEAKKILPLVLASNAGATVDQILSVTDAQIQTAVDNVVDFMSDAAAPSA